MKIRSTEFKLHHIFVKTFDIEVLNLILHFAYIYQLSNLHAVHTVTLRNSSNSQNIVSIVQQSDEDNLKYSYYFLHVPCLPRHPEGSF